MAQKQIWEQASRLISERETRKSFKKTKKKQFLNNSKTSEKCEKNQL